MDLLMAIGNGVWGKQPRDARKRKNKRGEAIRGWPNPYTPTPHTIRSDPLGGDYAKSDWALKTNERPVVKQMPL